MRTTGGFNLMISLIVAMDKNNLIGGENKLLWNIPGELKRFREITSGHPIIMGRKTHQSIGRVLPNRANIIITRDKNYHVEGARVVNSLEQAIEEAGKVSNVSEVSKAPTFDTFGTFPSFDTSQKEIFVIGGGQIYAEALPFADRLYVTVIDHEYDGDSYFPDYSQFSQIVEEKQFEENGIKYKTQILEKAI